MVKYDSNQILFQILADQAEWAVCGRAAGVINMENAKKQSLRIEVMPLVSYLIEVFNIQALNLFLKKNM